MIYFGLKPIAKFLRSNNKRLGFAGGMGQIISQLFANNEQGFAFDFNDLSTMYQDAAGTIPVTGVGQPVGLVLDKSKGLVLGDNIVINSGFDTGSGWAKGNGWTISNGAASALNTGGSTFSNAAVLTVGKFYQVTYSIISQTNTGSGISVYVGGSSGAVGIARTGIGTYTEILQCINGTTLEFHTRGAGAWSGSIDNVIVKELPGNHATQSTSAKRPLLKSAPNQLNYDGIDDAMTVNLSTQLTGCTVVSAIPNVGTQILTNQTISASYSSSTTNSGLLVINRALTSEETARVAQVFNKLAGV